MLSSLGNRRKLDRATTGVFESFVSLPRAGSNELKAFRCGDFDLVDPAGGHKHWIPRSWAAYGGDQAIQKMYLKELRKPLLIAGSDTLFTLRSIMIRGVDHTVANIRANTENTAILSALLMSVAITGTHLDDAAGICTRNTTNAQGVRIGIGAEDCNAQANAGAVSVILCLLTMTVAMSNIFFLNMLAPNSAAFQLKRNAYRLHAFPILLAALSSVAFGSALNVRMGIQRAQYEEDFGSGPDGRQDFLQTYIFVALLVWLGVFCANELANQISNKLELKQRDLDSTGKGFSDEFLESLGLRKSASIRSQLGSVRASIVLSQAGKEAACRPPALLLAPSLLLDPIPCPCPSVITPHDSHIVTLLSSPPASSPLECTAFESRSIHSHGRRRDDRRPYAEDQSCRSDRSGSCCSICSRHNVRVTLTVRQHGSRCRVDHEEGVR